MCSITENRGTRRGLDRILSENAWLVKSVIDKFFGGYRKSYEEEMTEAGRIALWRAAIRYDPEAARFSTFAHKYIRYMIIHFLAKEREARAHTVSFDSEYLDNYGHKDFVFVVENVETREFLKNSLSLLSENERKLLRDKFWEKKTVREIAIEEGISYESVRERIAKILHKIRVG